MDHTRQYSQHQTLLWFRTAVSLAALLLLSACTTASRTPSSASFELSPSDLRRAGAMAYYAQGLIEEEEHGDHSLSALRQFAKAAELSDGNVQLYLRVADACIANGLPEKAIHVLNQAAVLIPDAVEIHEHLASAYQFSGEPGPAIDAYVTAITKDPRRTDNYLRAAHLFFRQNEDAAALAIIDAGIRSAGRPDKVRSFCRDHGLRFIQRKQLERATGCLKVLARYEGNIHSLVGQLQEEQGMREQAIESYVLATEQDTPMPESFFHLARARLKDSPDDAIEVLLDGVRQLPGNMSLLMALGNVYAQTDSFDEAIDIYDLVSSTVEKSSGIPPDDFYMRFGALCEEAGDIAKATEIFEACIDNYPNAHQALNYLAYIWAEHSLHLDLALQYVDRALVHEPESAAYLDTRGWVYYKKGEYGPALEDIARAFKIRPNDATISAHLGDTWSALGDRHKALKHWKVSYGVDSANADIAEKLQANGIDLEALLLEQETGATHKAPGETPSDADLFHETE